MSERPPIELREYLEELVEALKEMDQEVGVYLIGSYARGDWLHGSDVDLIVVSRVFRGLDMGKRYSLVKKLARAGFGLDLLTYTPEEFMRVRERSVIVQDALEYAIRLA